MTKIKETFQNLLSSGGHNRVFSGQSFFIYHRKYKQQQVGKRQNNKKRQYMALANNLQIFQIFTKHKQFSQYFLRILEFDQVQQNFAFTMQSYNRNLFDQLLKEDSIPEMFKISIILQLIIACSQLHELKIVHNDLTTGNILIDDSNIIKICDFDNLTFFKQDYCSLIGTPKYKSPQYYEKLHELFDILFKEQIKSIYMIAQQLFCNAYPYSLLNTQTEYNQIHQKIKQRKLLIHKKHQNQSINKLLQDLSTKKTLKQIMEGDGFKQLKILISESEEYKILEWQQYQRTKYLSKSKFMQKQNLSANMRNKVCDEILNSDCKKDIEKLQKKIVSLCGKNPNSIATLLLKIPKNSQGNIVYVQFKKFIQSLELQIKEKNIAKIFQYLDNSDHNKAIDHHEMMNLFTNCLSQKQKQKIQGKWINRNQMVQKKNNKSMNSTLNNKFLKK